MRTPTATAGYSGTPLAKKLGIREGARLLVVDAPEGFVQLLAPIPERVSFEKTAGAEVDIAHVFCADREVLAGQLRRLRDALCPDAAVWVSWPKKAGRLPTTITEGVVRDIALPLGYVDIKVCAVNEVWSGLKLVVRKELR
jgi:hypothetical protein